MKLITIFAPCFNEEKNLKELYGKIASQIKKFPNYKFEILFIDNNSVDNTVEVIRELNAFDPRVKAIVNRRNFGQVRSPFWGLMQAKGDAVINMASDLQDPPEMIPSFIKLWEEGSLVVMATKEKSRTNSLSHLCRRAYYKILSSMSDVSLINDATGFGIYDRKVLDSLRAIRDPYPYVRGLISELGYEIRTLPFVQDQRVAGKSSNNLFTLYDFAMLGLVSHSMLPIRVAGMLGLLIGLFSFVLGVYYAIRKLVYWDDFAMGVAPLVVGIFFLFGLMFIFIGLLGEYMGSIHNFVRNRPLVSEKERIGFDE